MMVVSLKGIVLLFLLAALAFPSAALAEIKVLTLRHVPPGKVLPVVRELLNGSGKISHWENRLIINASKDEIATIEEVLRQIDVAPVMVRISVRAENRHARAGNRIGVAVLQAGETGRAPTGREPGSSGTGLSPGEGRRLGNAVEETEYHLRVRDGGQGFILMGESVPYVRELLFLARRHAGYGQSVDFQAINTGFWVRPVLEGDYVTLDIRPHLEGFQKNSSGVAGLPSILEMQALVTTVRIPLGQWVDLGGILRESDEISRAIVSWRAGNAREEKTVWVKVEK
jgi:type II secretory pathway component GspD/PulD (secretin)